MQGPRGHRRLMCSQAEPERLDNLPLGSERPVSPGTCPSSSPLARKQAPPASPSRAGPDEHFPKSSPHFSLPASDRPMTRLLP